jgi:uncharacterized Zn-finger protein
MSAKKQSKSSMASYLSAKKEVHVNNRHFVCKRSSPNCQWPVYLSAKEAVHIVDGHFACKRAVQIVNGHLISLKKKLSMLSMGTLSKKKK